MLMIQLDYISKPIKDWKDRPAWHLDENMPFGRFMNELMEKEKEQGRSGDILDVKFEFIELKPVGMGNYSP